MQTEIVSATNALEGFATTMSVTGGEGPFHTQVHGGWNSLPLSRDDLVTRARNLAERLAKLQDKELSSELENKIRNLPDQISWFQANTLPHLWSGNVHEVVRNFDVLMSNVEQALPTEHMPSWDDVAKSNLVPRDLGRRIRSLEAAIQQLEPRAIDLEGKIQRINEAHAAAVDLPTDLHALKEARDGVATYSAQAQQAAEDAATSSAAAAASQASIAKEEAAAAQLVKNIDSAYSAATTVGLAAAFSERANSLGRSTWTWVAMLVATLIIGGILGSNRLSSLQEVIVDNGSSSHWIWLNAAMSLLAIAAPVWFAWIATRQIGQRFRLAEDYAFKASVARAYEGYRKEAARLDPALEARLFASALDRLDEAPLRFISHEEHGSPYEALLASAGFQKALERIPSLRDALQTVMDRTTPAPTSATLAATAATIRPKDRSGAPAAEPLP